MLERVVMREQPAEDRITNFDEVPYGYSEEEAISEASRCLQCSHSPCTEKCPVHIDVTKFVNEISNGKFKEASASFC